MAKITVMMAGLAVLVGGCSNLAQSGPVAPAPPTATTAPAPTATATATPVPVDPPAAESPAGPEESAADEQAAANPVLPKPENQLAGDEYRWSQLLQRDAIFPIYTPQFAPAKDAPYDDEELVIGVEINGEAKAYAIGPLNSREMVNDTLGGIPILVTW